MILWLIAALAVAGPPPGVDLEDPTPWDRAADALLDGPPGCFEIVGRASWDVGAGRFGASRGTALFVGRLVDGVWTAFHVTPLGEVRREGRAPPVRVYDDEQQFVPLLGRVPQTSEGERTGPVNVLRDGLAQIAGDAETSWVSWDEARGGVRHVRMVALDGGGDKDVRVETFFPGAGVVPAEQALTFPERFRVNGLPPVFLTETRVDLRATPAGDLALPGAEAFRFRIGALGFTVVGAQSIAYTHATRCASAP